MRVTSSILFGETVVAVPETTISLDSWYLYLYQYGTEPLDAGCFSLDVDTFQLESVFVLKSCSLAIHVYINFPPSLLSTPNCSKW
jgi:hypothetical protein